MALQSRLFRGDLKLEAAATNDAAHIVQGTMGEHVRKIQRALNLLDGAPVAEDGIYGPETAAAVLAYKRNRNIVNYGYQTQADDIVGKMTIASLDADAVVLEALDDFIDALRRCPITLKSLEYGGAWRHQEQRFKNALMAFGQAHGRNRNA